VCGFDIGKSDAQSCAPGLDCCTMPQGRRRFQHPGNPLRTPDSFSISRKTG
jgi:hypothetical protein